MIERTPPMLHIIRKLKNRLKIPTKKTQPRITTPTEYSIEAKSLNFHKLSNHLNGISSKKLNVLMNGVLVKRWHCRVMVQCLWAVKNMEYLKMFTPFSFLLLWILLCSTMRFPHLLKFQIPSLVTDGNGDPT